MRSGRCYTAPANIIEGDGDKNQVANHPVTHELKIWPQYFEPVIDGRKHFELRAHDRNFQVGERVKITYILDGALAIPGFCLMSIEMVGWFDGRVSHLEGGRQS